MKGKGGARNTNQFLAFLFNTDVKLFLCHLIFPKCRWYEYLTISEKLVMGWIKFTVQITQTSLKQFRGVGINY